MKVTKSRSGAASKADAKLGVKKGGKQSKKAGKDPNKPKRPPSAFFVFMEEFRVEFKEKNPHNNAVSAVGKAAGAKWKAMSEADKAPYMAKAVKRKADYDKQMAAYNKKQAGGGDEAEDESDKSKSEVNDEEDGSGEEEEDDE